MLLLLLLRKWLEFPWLSLLRELGWSWSYPWRISLSKTKGLAKNQRDRLEEETVFTESQGPSLEKFQTSSSPKSFCALLIPALKDAEAEHYKFKAILGYIEKEGDFAYK